ncbi:MAG: DUF4178 domain-containing protein [Chloroflexota bacterium]
MTERTGDYGMIDTQCTSCGAGLKIENQFVRSVTCEFCGASYIISGGDGLSEAGKTTSLADYPSRFSVGQQGVIQGRSFTVLGRVRYTYDEGFWDEWQIEWHDGAPPDWLEEDEGYWTLYKRERVRGTIPPMDKINVGDTEQINNKRVFITEKRTARMMGSEGQFSSVLPISGQFGYASGTADGQLVSVNFWQDEIELSVGTDLEPHEIKFN